MAYGFARAVEKPSPSLKTRKRWVIEHPDELGYYEVDAVEIPDTADELIAKIGAGVKEAS